MVIRAQRGDQEAMAEFVRDYRGLVYNYSLRLLRSSDDAHDAAQETMVKALQGLATFDPERPLVPWLLKICRNCCVDAARARRRLPESAQAIETRPSEDTDVHGTVMATLRGEQLSRAIAELPPRYREIMVLRHVQNLEVNQIARQLQRPEGTVKSWLFRARALLREDRNLAVA
jgi:RNA polymerase sigma-70 factor (ECF subfamily)